MAKLTPLLDAARQLRTQAGAPNDYDCAPEYDAACREILEELDIP